MKGMTSLGFSVTKKTSYAALLQLAVCGATVLAAIIFVPHGGVLATAWVTTWSAGFEALLLWFVSQRLYKIEIDCKRIYLLGSLMLAALVISDLSIQAGGESTRILRVIVCIALLAFIPFIAIERPALQRAMQMTSIWLRQVM